MVRLAGKEYILIAVGQTAWLAAVGSLGMVDDPTTPVAQLVGLAAVTVMAVLAVAVVPAWRAGGRRPAEALRTE